MPDTPALPVSPLKRWLLLLLVCLLLVAGLGGLKYLQIQKAMAFAASFPERSATVTAVTAQSGSWQQIYRTIAEVRATRYLQLRNEVEGRITTVGFTGGDNVTSGQILLRLDSREEQAQLRATEAQLQLAELRLQRVAKLRADKLASPQDYDSAAADKAVLLANAAALAARIDKKTLSAPFAAATNLHTLEVGQYLAANSLITGLTGGAEQRWIDFDLPQDKANLEIGEPVSLSGPVVANKGAINAPMIATVVAIEPAINQASRTRGYRALLTDSDDNLSPGAVVDVAVQTGIVEGVIRLPATAVRRSSFGAYVYRLATAEPGASAPYRAERLPVNVVRAEGDEVIVTAGLEAGDLIAALGAFKLNAGMLVYVVERETLRDAVKAAAP